MAAQRRVARRESVKRTSWYLADAALQRREPRRGKASFTVNYDVGEGEYFAFWVESQNGKGLSYLTPAFDVAQELVGFPVLHLSVASDQDEALVFAYLEMLAPDGKAKVVATGRLAASYRKTGNAPYDTLGLPWPTGLAKDSQPLEPGRPVNMEFALTPTARVIPAGSRLRLVITGADPRQRNLQQIRRDPPPRITVLAGRGFGSRIDLPLVPQVAATPAN